MCEKTEEYDSKETTESESNLNVPLILKEDILNEPIKPQRSVNKVWSSCIPFSRLPSWLQDNGFLTNGYRPPFLSFGACFGSIFRIHTETVNIWTHLIGCVAFIYLALEFLLQTSVDLHFDDKIVFCAFFACAIFCLGSSFMCHTLYCHSPELCNLITRMDYCGIGLLIMGSFIPLLYYSFYCQFWAKLFYMCFMVSLGTICLYLNLSGKYFGGEWRIFRAGLFVIFGSSGIFPVLHYEFIEGWFSEASHYTVLSILLVGVLYVTGALIFMARIPERWFPGKCDIWFQSHQFFHIFVLAGAFAHYRAMLEMARYRLYLDSCRFARFQFLSSLFCK